MSGLRPTKLRRRSAQRSQLTGTSAKHPLNKRACRPSHYREARWKSMPIPKGDTYKWDAKSTYIKMAPYFENMPKTPPPLADIRGARVLAVLGDSVTTDHISPAGSIPVDSPAGKYLITNGVKPHEFNS